MEVGRLEISDFRNYRRAEVEFAAGVNLVVGRNGEGKTNLLEAVYVLCALGSHRTSSATVLVRHGADRSVLRSAVRVGGRLFAIDAEIRAGSGLRLLVNKAAAQRAPAAAVVFAPDDLRLAKGGPEERRRFMDQAASQLRPLGASERQEFERVLRQRNGALKAAQTSRRAAESLEVWDEQFVRSGARLVRNRMAVVRRLRPVAQAHYQTLSISGTVLDIGYRAAWAPMEAGEPQDEDLETLLADAVRGSRPREVERGTSLVGPHRDDLELRLDGADVRTFASQGEQRSIALSLRLAERDLIAETRESDPILLLDDVFSELDDERRGQLGDLMSGAGQAIVTATSIAAAPVGAAKTLRVEDGKVFDG